MNLGFTEMLFLFGLGLLLFGPRKLPEIGRQIGRAMAEFKKASNEFQSQLNDEVRQLDLDAQSERTIAPPSAQPSGTAARRLTTNGALDHIDAREDSASASSEAANTPNG
jgi:sec-independent protein translocase protein TatB